MKTIAALIFTLSFSGYVFGQNNTASKLITPSFKYHYFFKNETPKDSLIKLKSKVYFNNYLSLTENEESPVYNMPIHKPISEDKMPILEPDKEQKYHLKILKSE